MYEGGEAIKFDVRVATHLPELGYGVFANARVLGRSGYPVTSGDSLLIDAINVHESSKYRTYARPLHLTKPIELGGEAINLGSVFGATNYGHALLDGLGRMGLLSQAGYAFSRASHVILPAFPSATLRRLVEMAVAPDATLHVPDRGASYACERLVQTTFPGRPRVYSAAPAAFFRSLGVEPAGRNRRLILLRRGAKRGIANIDEVEALVDEYALEVYEPSDSPFSPADFAAASLIVGAHGAALADIAFAAPGTSVVELMPSGHKFPYFATLAASSRLQYQAVRGESISAERHADFVVDVDALRRAVELTAS